MKFQFQLLEKGTEYTYRMNLLQPHKEPLILTIDLIRVLLRLEHNMVVMVPFVSVEHFTFNRDTTATRGGR